MDMRGSGIDNFAVFLMCGQLLFNFFNEATSTSMSSVLSAAPLLKKGVYPQVYLPAGKVLLCHGELRVQLCGAAAGHDLYRCTLPPDPHRGGLPAGDLVLLQSGGGSVLAAATVFFRDIMHIWSVFITALLYFSAIFYDPTQMTFSIGGFNMQQIIKLNPMYWYITGFRRTVMWGIPLDFNMFAVCGICAVVSMLVGVWVFRKTQDRFVLHI